jgi:hypothetical protein
MERALVATVLLSMPGSALACAVCGVGTEANQQAFVDMTIFMTLLPLLLIGSGVGWIWWRYRQMERAALQSTLVVNTPDPADA